MEVDRTHPYHHVQYPHHVYASSNKSGVLLEQLEEQRRNDEEYNIADLKMWKQVLIPRPIVALEVVKQWIAHLQI